MTLVVKSNYAFKELCNNTCGLLEKEIFKESNVKESSENSDNSKDDKSETESNVESYYIRNHNSFLLYYDVNRLNNYTYHQSFFENQPKDIKDNPPELI